MSVDNKRLLAAMRGLLATRAELQEAINQLVEPTTTGYLHGLESWTGYVREGEYNVDIELALDPPRGAHEWNQPTVEKMERLKSWVGCDRVRVFALELGKVRYFAQWHKEGE